ncbi:MAG TPA: BamA/TamA family outer membrane protein [Vicinamibacteria bacterium]
MAHIDSFDSRDPFRPPTLLSLLPLLALLWAATARGDEAPAAAPSPAPGTEESTKKKVASVIGKNVVDNDKDRVHLGPLYPSLAIVSAGASVAPMVQLWQRDLGGSGLDVHGAASYSIRQYQFYALRVGRLPHHGTGPPSLTTSSDRLYPLRDVERLSGADNKLDLYVAYRHRDYPEEDFYGLGRDSLERDRTDFRLRDDLVELVGGWHFSPQLGVIASVGLQQTSLGAGRDAAFPDLPSRFDEAAAPGLAGPPRQLVLMTGALWDRRDEPGNPHRGTLLLASLSRFEDRRGDTHDFTRTATEGRLYVPLGSRRHVLAARAVASFDRPDDGARVPFYMQSSLGGSHVLRGYPAFRFRADKLAALSTEYRFEVVPRLELAAFYDLGQVAPVGTALRLSHPLSGWGGGVRFKSAHRVLARFDVARSAEGTRYLVKLGPAW